MFEKFGQKIQELQEYEFEVVRSRGSLALQQTQRNITKAELTEAFMEGMRELAEEYGFDVYITKEGVIMEIGNPSVLKGIKRLAEESDEDLSGYISIEHSLVIKNLDYNAELEEELYLEELALAKEAAAAREEKKKAKIKNDAETRATKARLREQRIAQLMKEKQ